MTKKRYDGLYSSNPIKKSKSKIIKTYILSPSIKVLKS